MTIVQQKLIDSYTVLVLAEKYITDEADRTNETQKLVPDTPITLADGSPSTIRQEVEIKVAEKTIEVLAQ